MIKYIQLHTGGKMFTLINELPAPDVVSGWGKKGGFHAVTNYNLKLD